MVFGIPQCELATGMHVSPPWTMALCSVHLESCSRRGRGTHLQSMKGSESAQESHSFTVRVASSGDWRETAGSCGELF